MVNFDVMSTEQNGVEVVMLPIHDGSLMLQFKGNAIYVDPDGEGNYAGLPPADYIFFTAAGNSARNPVRKPSAVVVTAGLIHDHEKKAFGEIEVESAGGGYIFRMAGRRFYASGDRLPATGDADLQHLDVAFLCAKAANDAAQVIQALRPRVVYPYRYGGADLSGLAEALQPGNGIELRRRRWY